MHIGRGGVTALVLAAVGSAQLAQLGGGEPRAPTVAPARAPAASPRASTSGQPEGPSVIVQWNQRAVEVAVAEDSFRTFKGHRALAMMHLAMHDAVNAVTPRFRQYALAARDTLADPVAAAAQAAHDVLGAHYPGAMATLDAELARELARRGDEPAVGRGVALGKQSAAALVAMRRNDGWDGEATHAFSSRVGAYRTTPPWNGFTAWPGFRHARTWGIAAAHQFRPTPPPSLDSPAYAVALDEVKRFGSAGSRERTPDQTGYAVWWMEYVEGSVNRLGRRLVGEHRLSLADAARLYALLNMSLFDTYVATWDAKYEYDHWRPYSAIREAADDGNPATSPDPAWEPLRPTPPFPEYVSAHAAACAATFQVLAHVLGSSKPFVMETSTAPSGMPTRRFARFDDAATECADSRVRLGWHFRYATDAGLRLGQAVARYNIEHHLGPSDTSARRP